MTSTVSIERTVVDRVITEVERLKDDLVETVSATVKIPSVNPKYPGQVYEDVVGGEGEVSKFMAKIYEGLGCKVDLFAIEPGRENAVGVLKGTGGGRSLIYNGHVDVVPPGIPAIGRAEILSRAGSTRTASGAAVRRI